MESKLPWFQNEFKERLRGEVYYEAVRSRGPGGQNVNKVSSAAVLYWHIGFSRLLRPDLLEILIRKLDSLINKEGLLQIRSDQFRDLPQNKEFCLDRLLEYIQEALHRPKLRRATKPTYSSKMKKLEGKKIRSHIKAGRQKIKNQE